MIIMMSQYTGGQIIKEMSNQKRLIYFALTLILVLSVIFVGLSCKSTTTTTPATTTKPVTTTTPAATTAPVTTKPATTTPAATTAAAKSGGILKIYLPTEPYALYPPDMTGQTDGENNNVCVETLFRLDEKGSVVPWLATDYIADPDSNTFTIHLRKGVKFTDGSDFNAAVVKWNMQQYQAGSKAELKNVSVIDTPDDYTVLLHLKTFDNTLIINLTTAADAGRVVSKQSFDANGGKTWADKNPVGTGPFKFVSWTKDVSIIYARNDNYWGGKPYLDQVQFVRIADPTTAQMTFASGGIDIYGPDPVIAKPLIDSGKYNWSVTPEGQIPALTGYAADPTSPFAKLEVRQAIAYAINPQAVSNAFGYGFWKVSNQWAVPGTWGFNANVAGYPFNTAKAKQLLASAGYTSPLPALLSFYNTSQALIDENTAYQKMLNDGGFNITLNPLQRPAFADSATNGKGWSGIIRAQGYSSVDPLVKYANVAAGLEFKGMYLPTEFTDLYKQAASTPDQATKQKLTLQLMSLAVDKYCMSAPLYIQGSPIIKQKRVMDDGFGVQPYRFLNPMTWVTDGK
jgi:peptide/nickel transport system substrate-binding protein